MLRNFKRFTLQVVAGANLATIFMMFFVDFYKNGNSCSIFCIRFEVFNVMVTY